MDEIADTLANDVVAGFDQLQHAQRYLVGISGIPGSGKSTIAKHVCDAVNRKLRQRQEGSGSVSDAWQNVALIVGMDGWHYPRSTLETFPDPKEARDRRGAAFTFDALSFADFVAQLKSNPFETVRAPSFSHSEKDPVADDIAVEPSHRIIFVEGLYCNCNDGHWAKGAQALDERWVVEVSKEIARERLRVRHVQTGVAKDEQEALWRADNNDLPNGDYLFSHILEPSRRIRSLEDNTWS
ncbi:unnamed protein product [Sympodiomycopsis kandeliae]